VRHHATHVAQARRTGLGDRVVDDLLELVLGERLGHELFEDRELGLLLRPLLLAAAGAKPLRRLAAAPALTLERLRLFLFRARALQVLLRGSQAVEDQPQGVAAGRVAREHRILHLALEPLDESHSSTTAVSACAGRSSGFGPSPRMCQCRWKIVWPALGPTFT